MGYLPQQLPIEIDLCDFVRVNHTRLEPFFNRMRSQRVQALVWEGQNQNYEEFMSTAENQIRFHMERMMGLRRRRLATQSMSPSFDDQADFVNCNYAQAVFGVQCMTLVPCLEGYESRVYQLKWKPSKRCTCGRLRNVDSVMGDVCGQCFIGRVRRENDLVFLPNCFHEMNVEGLRFNRTELARWRRFNAMPTLEQQNNIFDVVSKRFTFDSHLTWRGSFPGHRLSTNLAIVRQGEVPAIEHALVNERFLALTIEQTNWLQGEENLGVFALRPILQNTVVCVYSGEMFFASELPFWTVNRSSRVRLGYVDADEVVLSPEKRANVGRYLNHDSTDNSNIRATWVIAETQDDFELVLVMLSNRNIRAGQELRWCYGYEYVQDHLSQEKELEDRRKRKHAEGHKKKRRG